MSALSPALYLALIPVSAAAGAAGWLAWRSPGGRGLARLAEGLGWLAAALALASWAARWALAGHLPLFGTYESSLSLALAVLLAALVAQGLTGRRARVWALAGPISAAVLAHGLAFDPTVYALTISERSWVVDLHAVFAWAAFGALSANAAIAAALLARRRRPGRDPGAREGEDAGPPSLRAAGRWLSTSLSAGFLLHSAMMASGSFYKFLLFGEAWSFDPIEILGFIAWLAYGALLHLHLMGGWEGRRLARGCLGLFVLLVISYRGIVYFPAWSTYHIFDMDLRIHVTGEQRDEKGASR